jgi:hypothetical protein
MPSRYPAAREAEDRFHSRYGAHYVVADYTTAAGVDELYYEDYGHDEPAPPVAALTSEASLGPRPSTAPGREKSSSGWRNLNKYAPLSPTLSPHAARFTGEVLQFLPKI